MKSKKQPQHIQNYDMDTIIENQNDNKQWTHMLNDLQRNKFDTPLLELQKSILFQKKHAHGNDNSQQPKICELFDVQT